VGTSGWQAGGEVGDAGEVVGEHQRVSVELEDTEVTLDGGCHQGGTQWCTALRGTGMEGAAGGQWQPSNGSRRSLVLAASTVGPDDGWAW
jgi:hypothetical protein